MSMDIKCGMKVTVGTCLFHKVLNNAMLGHLRSNSKSSLQLLFNPYQHLMIFFSCESFRAS